MSYDYLQSDLSDLDDEVVTVKAVSTAGTSVKKERQWTYPPDHPSRTSRTGKQRSPELKEKMRIRFQDPVLLAKLSAANKGKKRSEETLAKMRIAAKMRIDRRMEELNNLHTATWTVVATGKVYYGTRKLVAEELGITLGSFEYRRLKGHIIKQGN